MTSEAGGIPPLIALARVGTAEQKEIAAAALRNLSFSAGGLEAIAAAGGIAPPSATLSGLAPLAASGLAPLAARPSAPLHRVATSDAGGIALLVALARNGTAMQKEKAAGALMNLGLNTENQVAITAAGVTAPPSMDAAAKLCSW